MTNYKIGLGVRCNLRATWFSLFVLALGPLHVPAQETLFQSLRDGVALKVGNENVEIHVASPHAFRLHLSSSEAPGHNRSVFLSGEIWPATPFTVTHQGTAVGIKTNFGELQVDPSARKWSLEDAQGKVLSDWAPLADTAASSGNNAALLVQAGGCPTKAQPLFYGSGNDPHRGALTQTEAQSRTGNGSTALPQYWSNAGYGALMISANDNKPASWRADDKGGVTWNVPGPSADLYLAPCTDLYVWLRADAELTGFAPVPPLWTFGYMQSRWGWKDKAYIDDTLARFHKDNLPVDAFIFDFEWYTPTPDYDVPANGKPDFQDFGWNPLLLPDPKAQLADLLKQGLHVVGIRKPRLGNSDALTMARAKGWILPANPNDPNSDAIKTRNLDFSNPEVQAYWQQNNRKFLEAGMAGFWNDEGETTFTEYSYWNMTEVALFQQVKADARFWSINRSYAPGMQRLGAAVWTGDIGSDWGVLFQTCGDLLSDSLAGMPYSGCDIGGFDGNPTPELLARWMEAGVFFPIMRAHSSIDSTPHFPWLFGDEAENAIRKALDLRSQLIPYYYSLAYQSYKTGAPIMRPLVMEFPTEDRLTGVTDEWLMGKGLLAGPILHEGGERDVYVPLNDAWYDFSTNEKVPGGQLIHQKKKLDEIPIYVRAGTLLPLGPVVQNTEQAPSGPLELRIYPGHDGAFTLVQDDGTTRDYQQGMQRLVTYSWDDSYKTLRWSVTGKYAGNHIFHQMKAVLISPAGPVEKQASLDQDGSVIFN